MKKVLFKLDFCLGLVAVLLLSCCSTNDGTDPIRQTQIFSIDPTSGTVGEYVVIEGKDFGDRMEGNIVKFNGVQASILTASTSRLVVYVPTNATTGPISVKVDTRIAKSEVDFMVKP
ncbi:IPT/TIG domain-containing protein [Flagellimonas myxillae]|uniref:IPT/TIG domain-containing protein n=1 Tax=Flagellimonas myxillae TaxID=2942214 RepID=UPI00201F16C7|nr:IPT/TIG domain-containing protein [Muricauda myxillae]MCL6267345.1 IPT/TIG domain-containing protein [Muricauda myxillae]